MDDAKGTISMKKEVKFPAEEKCFPGKRKERRSLFFLGPPASTTDGEQRGRPREKKKKKILQIYIQGPEKRPSHKRGKQFQLVSRFV